MSEAASFDEMVASTLPAASGAGEASPVQPHPRGFAAPCPDCGHLFVRPTAAEAAEAVVYRDEIHGQQFCALTASRLSKAAAAELRVLYNVPSPEDVERAVESRQRVRSALAEGDAREKQGRKAAKGKVSPVAKKPTSSSKKKRGGSS